MLQVVEIEAVLSPAPQQHDVPSSECIAPAGSIDRLDHGHAFAEYRLSRPLDLAADADHRRAAGLKVALNHIHLDLGLGVNRRRLVSRLRRPGELLTGQPLRCHRIIEQRQRHTAGFPDPVDPVDFPLLGRFHAAQADFHPIAGLQAGEKGGREENHR